MNPEAGAEQRPSAVVVNDDPAQLHTLVQLLLRANVQSAPYTSAEEALEAMRRQAPPDIIVTDVYMPEIDGWRFCRLLRSPDYPTYNQTPILVVSATFAGETTDRIATDIGADAFLPLPVEPQLFCEQVQALLRREETRTIRRVLVVEDAHNQAAIIKTAFEVNGYHAEIAYTLAEASNALERQSYDVAVLDYHLPDGKADTLLEPIRSRHPDCVCLMITHDPGPDLALKWMKRGAAAYLQKPFDAAYLIELCARAHRERTLLRAQDLLEARTRELSESESRFRQLFTGSRDGLIILDPDGHLLDANSAFCSMVGYTLAELKQPDVFHGLAHGDSQAREQPTAFLSPLTPDAAPPQEAEYVNKQGRRFPVEIQTYTVRDPTGHIQYFWSVVRDITERKHTEEQREAARKRANRQRNAIAEMALDPAVHDGNIPAALQRITRLVGQTLQVERVGIWELSGKQDEERCLILLSDGNNETSTQQTLDTARFPRYFKAMLTESRINAHDAQNDPRTSELAETYLKPHGITSMLDAAILVGGKLRGTLCIEHIGPARTWHSDEESFASTAAAILAQLFLNAGRKQAEKEHLHMQNQLHQAQKMESIGRLAGGVAHDFNNMLQTILGNLELSLSHVPPGHPAHHELIEIRKAAERSANLTEQLLAFARKQTIAPRHLDLNDTIEKTLNMLRRLIGEHINLTWHPTAQPAAVKFDPGQIAQILTNLCVNARDGNAEHIAIKTCNTLLDDTFCSTRPGFKPGSFIALTITDNGCGMDAHTRKNLFEPFFTTKKIGEGTGLGLATVYGIVKQNQGYIDVESEPGCGSTFTIYLPPLSDAPPPHEQTASEPTPKASNHETILLVEDETAILKMTTTMLKRLGYDVLTANNPRHAVDQAKQHPGEIHLLITDVVMPQMNGRDLAHSIQPLFPNMRSLFMSGYTANVIAHHGVLDEGVHFISKPFTMNILARKVRETLDAPPAPIHQPPPPSNP